MCSDHRICGVPLLHTHQCTHTGVVAYISRKEDEVLNYGLNLWFLAKGSCPGEYNLRGGGKEFSEKRIQEKKKKNKKREEKRRKVKKKEKKEKLEKKRKRKRERERKKEKGEKKSEKGGKGKKNNIKRRRNIIILPY